MLLPSGQQFFYIQKKREKEEETGPRMLIEIIAYDRWHVAVVVSKLDYRPDLIGLDDDRSSSSPIWYPTWLRESNDQLTIYIYLTLSSTNPRLYRVPFLPISHEASQEISSSIQHTLWLQLNLFPCSTCMHASLLMSESVQVVWKEKTWTDPFPVFPFPWRRRSTPSLTTHTHSS